MQSLIKSVTHLNDHFWKNLWVPYNDPKGVIAKKNPYSINSAVNSKMLSFHCGRSLWFFRVSRKSY